MSCAEDCMKEREHARDLEWEGSDHEEKDPEGTLLIYHSLSPSVAPDNFPQRAEGCPGSNEDYCQTND